MACTSGVRVHEKLQHRHIQPFVIAQQMEGELLLVREERDGGRVPVEKYLVGRGG